MGAQGLGDLGFRVSRFQSCRTRFLEGIHGLEPASCIRVRIGWDPWGCRLLDRGPFKRARSRVKRGVKGVSLILPRNVPRGSRHQSFEAVPLELPGLISWNRVGLECRSSGPYIGFMSQSTPESHSISSVLWHDFLVVGTVITLWISMLIQAWGLGPRA